MQSRLIDLKRGEKARIVRIEGGPGFRRNLEIRGVRDGKLIEVVAKHPIGGPIVIRIGNMEITIGRGMASRIIVEK